MRKICIVTGTRAEHGLLYWPWTVFSASRMSEANGRREKELFNIVKDVPQITHCAVKSEPAFI